MSNSIIEGNLPIPKLISDPNKGSFNPDRGINIAKVHEVHERINDREKNVHPNNERIKLPLRLKADNSIVLDMEQEDIIIEVFNGFK